MKRVIWLLLLTLIAGPAAAQQRGLYEELMTLSAVIGQMQDNHADEIVAADLLDAAIRGMLASVDPHSYYLNARQRAQYEALEAGERAGVGLELAVIDDEPAVVSVLPGGPADGSRIRPGDVLETVDGTPLAGRDAAALRLLLSGAPRTKVRLGLRRLDGTTYDVVLRRGMLPTRSVGRTGRLNPHTGYVQITHFTPTTGEEVAEAVKTLARDGIRRLVLDLRGNPGGALRGAVETLDLFLPEGTVLLETRGRKEALRDTYTAEHRAMWKLPLAVLIDAGSASAAEAVAGSLQDHDRALLLGARSFGKGLVMMPFLLDNGGLLMMTVGRYYTPSGRLLQRDYAQMTVAEYYDDLAREALPAQETFRTAGGRTVHGGGGVRPDLPVTAEAWPEAVAALAETPLFFEAAGAAREAGAPAVLDDALVQRHAHAAGVAVEALAPHAEVLAQLLAVEVARLAEGDEAALRATLAYDEVLRQAMERLPEADRYLTPAEE